MRRIQFEDELGIAESTHFWDVQAFEFIRRGHALSDEDIDQPIHSISEWEDEAQQGGYADELSDSCPGSP